MAASIHPTADVAADAVVGDGTKIWHEAQVCADAHVGGDCTIGKGAFISTGSRIGNLVKIGNHANVMGAQIADQAFIGPQAYLMEDAHPRATNPDGTRRGPTEWTSQPVWVGLGATVGGGALVLPGVRVGEWAMVSAGSVVHRDIPAYGFVAGNPARQLGWSCQCGQRLDEALRCACGRAYLQSDAGLAATDLEMR
jgi:UDP-2-acetamido-3-amino-2,3-dideoxy-glucuronate N-acetyltransferase